MGLLWGCKGATSSSWGYPILARTGMDEDHTVALWDWKLGQRLIDAYLTSGKNEVRPTVCCSTLESREYCVECRCECR